ncbi:MAG: nicotinate (nicotinamide) nucleotide adenylyltransferase [Bacteroidota bacterium]
MKTGLFFGSFNPVHIGHLAIANYMKEFTDLDAIWFVVSPQNPLKNKSDLLDDHLRLHMMKLVFGDDGDNDYYVSDIEFSMPKPSYTVNTIKKIQLENQGREFVMIIGSDSLMNLPKWDSYEEIIDLCKHYVYPRTGYPAEKFKTYKSTYFIDAPKIDVSSSFVRKGLRDGHEMKFFLPSIVYNYIKEHKLYS